ASAPARAAAVFLVVEAAVVAEGGEMKSKNKVFSEAASPPDKRFEALHALYDNKQQWVRHYETLLGHINPVSTTVSIAIAAYIAENFESRILSYFGLAIPSILIAFTLWFNWWCDREIRRQFEQIVFAEIGMGFFDIQVNGSPVLPSSYRNSPNTTRPIIKAGYALQIAAVMIVLATFAIV
ncbi:MAG: hypothetical protein AAF311_03730, partial [Pseudomonadota bacterium]